MKKIIILTIALLLISLTATYGGESTAEEVKQEMPENTISTRIYEVYGMDCPGCHGGLEKLVKKIPAVESADANWKKKQMKVTVKPGAELNDEDIYDAIKRANFTAGKRIK